MVTRTPVTKCFADPASGQLSREMKRTFFMSAKTNPSTLRTRGEAPTLPKALDAGIAHLSESLARAKVIANIVAVRVLSSDEQRPSLQLFTPAAVQHRTVASGNPVRSRPARLLFARPCEFGFASLERRDRRR